MSETAMWLSSTHLPREKKEGAIPGPGMSDMLLKVAVSASQRVYASQ